MNAAGNGNGKVKTVWQVQIDTGTCSLCEMCVNRCPSHALFIQRQGTTEEILFNYRLCDGCLGEMFCEGHCPEKSVKVTRIPVQDLSDEPVSLVVGEMSTCQDCGVLFMPERKLATLLEKQKITPKSVQHYCPNCRRNHLVDSCLTITGQI